MPPKKKSPAEKKTLAETLAELRKNNVRVGFDDLNDEPEFWSTGNLAIDTISNGGVPKGKVSEFLGKPASGKTTTAVSTARTVMDAGGTVAFFDYERAIDKPYFRALGVDPNSDQFLYFTPRHLEEGANVFRALVATGEVQLGVFDSVARMATEHELTAETGKVLVADRAKMMYQFLRQLVDPLADTKTSVIFLNHLLDLVDATFMGQQMAARGIKRTTSPGGNALPFYASMRLQFTKREDLTAERFNALTNAEDKVKIGSTHEVFVLKNKVGTPGGKALVTNVMGSGFSQEHTAWDILESYGAVRKKGTWYTAIDPRLTAYMGDTALQGADAARTKIVSAGGLEAMVDVASDLLSTAMGNMALDNTESEPVELPEELAGQTGVFAQ